MPRRIEQRDHHRQLGQLLPLSERRPATTLTPWQEICGVLTLLTNRNRKEQRFVSKHRQVIKGLFDARTAVIIGKDPLAEVKFIAEHTPPRKLWRYLNVVRDRLPVPEEQPQE